MSEQEPVWPSVSMDLSLGKRVQDIDIDLDTIASHLRSHGVSDEKIASLSIEINSDAPRTCHKTNKQGDFRKRRNAIRIFLGHDFRVHDTVMELERKYGVDNEYFDVSNRILNREANQTLSHELEHAIVASEHGMIEERLHNRKFIAQCIGAAITSNTICTSVVYGLTKTADTIPYDGSFALMGAAFVTNMYVLSQGVNAIRKHHYDISPEEIRCRGAEASSGFVSLSLRQSLSESVEI